jgi:ATP-dependent DNA helicase RecG
MRYNKNMDIHLSTPIERLTRVGAITAKRLSKLGIKNAKDLLEHYPFRFEDFSARLASDSFLIGQKGSITGIVTDIKNKKTPYKKMTITEAFVDDQKGDVLKIVWFNQPFIGTSIKSGDTISVAGTIERDFKNWFMKNPSYEKPNKKDIAIHTNRLVPIYSATLGITQKQIRFLIAESLGATKEFKDPIPKTILKNLNLPEKQKAIQDIHLPKNKKDYENALKRLKFEELFIIQLAIARTRAKISKETAPKIPFNQEKTKQLVGSLPFKLTDSQKKSAWQILKDIEKEKPANRLLQGEVGCGKTVVASIAALNAAESGFQTAIMAPTEILAVQHYKTISEIFPNKRIALLTSKHAKIAGYNLQQEKESEIKQKQKIKKAIEEGLADIIIGTHSIIQKDVMFKNLGLIVVDEQHRFGVKQRQNLKIKNKETQKTTTPHFISMTATPIPRSLALTLYGDLDISTIRELPSQRKPIITKLVSESSREEAYKFIKTKIRQGNQVFVICPIIEESDALGVKSATEEFQRLKSGEFAEFKISLLHGKQKTSEKEKTMEDFKQKKLDILVATAVIEVGVDVPNATIIMIEGAERFGLSQLHQFRGRVGRGEKQSFCFLFSENPNAKERLKKFIKARDGFEISEIDLALRGPGSLYGIEQSGRFSDLKVASIFDFEIASIAKKQAEEIIKKDIELSEFPALKYETEKREQDMHFE